MISLLRSTRCAVPFLAALAAWLPAPALSQTELIENGDFETGDLSGWTVETLGGLHLGSWSLNDGTLAPPGPVPLPFEPLSGDFDAMCIQVGPGVKRLTSAPIVLPDDVPSAALSWLDSIRNLDFMGRFEDPGQEFRVQLLDANEALIAQVYSTDPGDAPVQAGPNLREFDVTADLAPYAGETVYLRFELQDELFFFNVNVDEVSLLVGSSGPTLIEVAVDVKPGGDDNPINLKVNLKQQGRAPAAGGALPVAILGAAEYAVEEIDGESVLLGDPRLSGAVQPWRWGLEDVNGDGLADLVLHYSIVDMVVAGAIDHATTELWLLGSTLDGTMVMGGDVVRIVPAAAPKKQAKPAAPPAPARKNKK